MLRNMQVWDVLPAIAPGVLPSPGEYDYKAHGFLPTAADIAGKEVARKIFEFFAEHSVYGEQKGGIGLYSVLQELDITTGQLGAGRGGAPSCPAPFGRPDVSLQTLWGHLGHTQNAGTGT